MNSEQPKRFYEVKFGAETEFAILPGENPLDFELLQTKLAEEFAPDGLLEEEMVFTIAKCMWRKQRYQRFLAARRTAASFDPDHEAYDEVEALTGFFQALVKETDEDELQRLLNRLGGHLADDLRHRCPRRKFKTVKAWIKAMQRETMKLFERVIRFGSPPDEVLIGQSAAVLTDEVFARELDFEERINAELDRALKRLFEIKAVKQQIPFRALQRFDHSHPGRLAGVHRK